MKRKIGDSQLVVLFLRDFRIHQREYELQYPRYLCWKLEHQSRGTKERSQTTWSS